MSTTRQDILACIARLSTMSQIGAVNYEARSKEFVGSASTAESPGGNVPAGGVDRRDDKEPEFFLRSADHFIRRLAKAHSESSLRDILHDAELAVKAWTHTPVPRTPGPEQDPERDSFRWKCMIADDPRSLQQIKAHYGVSRSTVERYQDKYRGVISRRAA